MSTHPNLSIFPPAQLAVATFPLVLFKIPHHPAAAAATMAELIFSITLNKKINFLSYC